MFSVHRYEAGVIRENYAESIRSRNEEQTILYVYIYTLPWDLATKEKPQ